MLADLVGKENENSAGLGPPGTAIQLYSVTTWGEPDVPNLLITCIP
jgi:hypothetical protein